MTIIAFLTGLTLGMALRRRTARAVVLPDVNADPNVLPPCAAIHVHGPGCQPENDETIR
jgi:hypothetical protein